MTLAKLHIATCEWFAKCSNETSYALDHPILGYVPTCQRCIDKLEKIGDSKLTVYEMSY